MPIDPLRPWTSLTEEEQTHLKHVWEKDMKRYAHMRKPPGMESEMRKEMKVYLDWLEVKYGRREA